MCQVTYHTLDSNLQSQIPTEITDMNPNPESISKKPVTLVVSGLGLLGTIMGIIIGIDTYLFPPTIEINYEILSETNLLEIDKDISNLIIQYAGEDLKANNSNLKILVLNIENSGDKTITKDSYDIDDLLGVEIRGGRVIESPIIVNTSASNKVYLEKNLSVEVVGDSEVRFSDIILEPGDFFTVKLPYVHINGDTPEIVPVGKIAGVNGINISRPDDNQEESLLLVAFGGSVLIQFIRIFTYLLLGILSLTLTIIIVEYISNTWSKFIRKRCVKKFKMKRSTKPEDEVVFSRYISDGAHVVVRMKALLKNEEFLKEKLKFALHNQTRKVRPKGIISAHNEFSIDISKKIEEDALAKLEGEELIINERLKITLFGLVNFIEDNYPEKKSLQTLSLNG